MEPNPDRRNDGEERVPVRIEVELGHDGFRDAFPADALNLSRGGISMRAACLPDLHSRLLCRFRCAPSGVEITALGEVVWAHLEGEREGEFGLAFVDLDHETEWLIEEMLAEQAASMKGETREAAAPVITLELEGSPEPIAGRLASRQGEALVFEQQLELLRLGRGVLAHAPGAEGKTGSIAHVELRMVGSVPMLAVTVAFDPSAQAIAQARAGETEPLHDTEPDLVAPAAPAPAPQRYPRLDPTTVTVTEFAARHGAESADSSSDTGTDAGAEADAALAAETRLPTGAGFASAAGTVLASHAPANAGAPAWSISPLAPSSIPRPSAGDREFSKAFVLEPPGDEEPEPAPADDELEFDGFREPSALASAVKALVGAAAGVLRALRAGAGAGAERMAPRLRGAWVKSEAGVRRAYGRNLGFFFGALRRLLLAALPQKRRRTAGAPGAKPRAASGLKTRGVALALLAMGAAALGVYALSPSPHDNGLELHRAVVPESVPARAVDGVEPATAPPQVAPQVAPRVATTVPAEPSGSAAAVPARVAATPAVAAAPPNTSAPPAASQLASSSPFAVDVRPSATVKPEATATSAGGKLRFGAARAPRGHRFTLRMSGRIKTLEGVAQRDGFSVTIPGCLSLDRAGPISSAVKSVQRAMVMNKGDHAELAIHFADGKQPAYQVSADGSTLVLVIED